jgi:hypothetical protein
VDGFFRRLASLPRTDEPPAPLRDLADAVSRLVLSGPAAMPGQATAQDTASESLETALVSARTLGQAEQAQLEALMEHLGHLAVEVPREAAAAALAGALVPLTVRRLPVVSAPPHLTAVPRLVQATATLVRGLRADSSTRPLIRMVPTLLACAVERTWGGNGVSGSRNGARPDAVEALAAETRRLLADPVACTKAYGRSRSADRRFHRASGESP